MSDTDPRAHDPFGLNDSDSDGGAGSDSETERTRTTATKRRKLALARQADSDADSAADDSDAEASDPGAQSARETTADSTTAATDAPAKPKRNKKLTATDLEKSRRAIARTGVVYLSRVPPFMKPSKVKDLLSRFGPVNRIFLAPEDPKAHARRVKAGGNKKKMFDEGWVEFASKRDAKLAAETLNGNIIGGKKGGFYHDDLWNIKYLKRFKWHHLQAQISYENASRQAKMRAEIAKETKVNKTFLRNYERAKMVESMQQAKKRKRGESEAEPEGAASTAADTIEVRRNWRQYQPKGSYADAKQETTGKAEKAKELFSSVF